MRTITGTLSGSCNATRLAKDDYEAKHPTRKVFVIDSLSTGPEMMLIIEKLQSLIEQVKNFETICRAIMAYKGKKDLQKIVHYIKELGFKGGKIRIDHCNNHLAADALKKLIMNEYPKTDMKIGKTFGLCSFYAEKGGLMIGFEKC